MAKLRTYKEGLTEQEKKQFDYMVDLYGGDDVVDKAKLRKRILALRKRKSNRTTRQDMEDMFGY